MKKLILFVIILSFVNNAFGQAYQIKGRVVSNTSTSVEYANVVLRASDSTFVTGGITDQRGRFQMENIKSGQYNLHISCLGYGTKNIQLADFTKNIDLGNVVIDSTSIALDEITITASHIINQPDRKIILPTPSQLKASTNGLSLLQQLQLSRIHVDLMQKKIEVSGGEVVQLRINGVEASIQEVSALRPEDVLRIEHHDDPGLRYNGADAVIDYITRRKNRGGYVSLDTQNSPHVWFGNNQITTKFNYKKSEFSAVYYGGYRSLNNMWRENTETFNFEDGTSLTRVEDGTPDKWARNWNYMHLNYSYQEPEKYFFNATIRASLDGSPHTNYRSRLYPVNQPAQGVYMTDRSSDYERRPSIDLYYQHSLKNKQTLILNVVGTYISTETDREYIERRDDEVLTEIVSKIDGDKYSLIGEGIYEKAFKTGKLSTGLKHTQSFSDNKYSGNTNGETKMKQADTYAYVEYQAKIKKFNYSVGIGGTRSWFKQSGEGYQDYTFRPTLRMTYTINDNSFIRYRGNISSSSPSLSDLNETEQLIDSLQIRRGNPNLRPVTRYNNSLTYNLRYGILSTNLFIGHWYYDKPIMEQTIRDESNKFIRTMDNQKSWQKLNTELEIKVRPLKDLLTLSLTTGVNYYDSKGHTYHHTHTNWYYRAEVMANYKNWMAMFQIQNHRTNFYGETLNYGENFHMFGIMYKHKQFSCGVMTLNPFVDNWKSGSENYSAYAPSKNWHYLKESSRLFTINLAYNFSFGRKYQSGSKRLNNEDSESGVLKGGK